MTNEALTRYISRISSQLSASGVKVDLGKAVPYGQQLIVRDESGQMTTITLYAGKKGERAVIGGKESFLRQQVSAALGQPQAKLDLGSYSASAPMAGDNGYVWPNYPLWAGSDESGKGDLFGPLVVASVLLTREQAEQITALGVKDSKQLTDKQIAALAVKIKAGVTAYKVTSLQPLAYNRLYDAMKAERKNLNDLLAWCHAKVLNDLLGEQSFLFAIVDRFCVHDLISRRLKGTPPSFSLLQIPKGERDPAVAAASILARDQYVRDMARLSEKAGVCLPKGASVGVKECAGRLLRQLGPDEIKQYVKWHFKTMAELLE